MWFDVDRPWLTTDHSKFPRTSLGVLTNWFQSSNDHSPWSHDCMSGTWQLVPPFTALCGIPPSLGHILTVLPKTGISFWFSAKPAHSESPSIRLMTPALVLRLWHLLIDQCKIGCKIKSVIRLTHFITVMTYDWDGQLWVTFLMNETKCTFLITSVINLPGPDRLCHSSCFCEEQSLVWPMVCGASATG